MTLLGSFAMDGLRQRFFICETAGGLLLYHTQEDCFSPEWVRQWLPVLFLVGMLLEFFLSEFFSKFLFPSKTFGIPLGET